MSLCGNSYFVGVDLGQRQGTVTAVKAVHRAYFAEGSLLLVVNPSTRQTAEFMRSAPALLQCRRTRVPEQET